MKNLGGGVGIAVKRLILKICEIYCVNPEALLVREVYTHTAGILALVERVQLRGKPVAVAADKSREVRDWPRIQDADPVRSPTRADVFPATSFRQTGLARTGAAS